MKRFLINTALFVVLLGVLNLMVKLTLNSFYFNNYNYVELDKQIYLLADSHGEALGEFENGKIFNFSSASDSYLDIKRKVNFLIENSKVETIVLTVDDHTLSPYRSNLNNKDRSVYFSSQENFSSVIEYVWERYVNYNLVILNPKYGTLIKRYMKSGSPLLNNGDNSGWKEMSVRSKRQVALERYNKQFIYDNNSKVLKDDLIDIIGICQENNIKVLGIKFPLSETYNQIIGQNSYNADSLIKSRNIKVLNFNKKKNFSDDKFFKDQDHLNKRGAEKVKKALIDSII